MAGGSRTSIADWFVEHRLTDGAWNCSWVQGSRRSSFHSTLNSLFGILDHETRRGGSPALQQARRDGEEYLLQRGLMRRLSTGEVHAPWATHFAYPYRYLYSVLRAADYFRAASLHDGRRPDDRKAEALKLIRCRERPRRDLAPTAAPRGPHLVRRRQQSRLGPIPFS